MADRMNEPWTAKSQAESDEIWKILDEKYANLPEDQQPLFYKLVKSWEKRSNETT